MLQLILQAVSYPFGRRLSWMTGLLAIALSLLVFGYYLTKPPSQFTDAPPRFGVVLSGNCKGDVAIYATIDRNRDIILGVSIHAAAPSEYSRTFKRLSERPDRSASYAPLSDPIFCQDLRLAVVGPPRASIEVAGAIYGDVIAQNQAVGSKRRRGIVESALRDETAARTPAEESSTQALEAESARLGYISVADDPDIIQPIILSTDQPFRSDRSVFGIGDPDFADMVRDCIGPDEAVDLAQYPCMTMVEAVPFDEFVAVSSPGTECAQPGGEETLQCTAKSSIALQPVTPVAMLFKVACADCRKGRTLGFTLDAIYTELSTWILGEDRPASLTVVSTETKTPTPWRDDDATRTKRFDDWVSSAEVGAYSTTIDSYVWTPKNLAEQRQFNLMWGAIVLGLGMTILIELLIVTIHPGIRLQTTPPDEDEE